MSARYEFVDPRQASLLTDPFEMSETFEEPGDIDLGTVALIIGDPWDCAAVLTGTREGLAGKLRKLLALVEEAPQ